MSSTPAPVHESIRSSGVYHIPLGHRRKQVAYLYSLLKGTSVMLGSSLR